MHHLQTGHWFANTYMKGLNSRFHCRQRTHRRHALALQKLDRIRVSLQTSLRKSLAVSFIADGHVYIVGNATELLHLHTLQQSWVREPYDTLWNRLNFVNWHLNG
jgi:hypothetical protein